MTVNVLLAIPVFKHIIFTTAEYDVTYVANCSPWTFKSLLNLNRAAFYLQLLIALPKDIFINLK